MSDTSGPISRTPFAYYDPATRSLRTSQDTFPLGLPTFSPTLPKSGSMRNGQLFARPTLAHPIGVSACSSLLPTPSVADATGGHMTRSGSRSNELLLPGIAVQLLPTPRASDGPNGGPNQRNGNGDMALPSAVLHYLPTPTSRDGKGQNQRNDQTCLHGAIMDPPSTGGSTR